MYMIKLVDADGEERELERKDLEGLYRNPHRHLSCGLRCPFLGGESVSCQGQGLGPVRGDVVGRKQSGEV